MASQFSEFPDFSTQESQYEIGEEVSQTGKNRAPRGSGFNPEEDKLLISAWLNIGMDGVTGNEQKSKTFWGRITDYYHQYKTFESDRSQQMLTQRWGKLQKEVNKFSGCFATIRGRNESGKTEQDKIADAKSLYEEQENKRFTLDHAWVILRHQPKWIQTMQEFDAKTSKKISRSSSSTTSTHIDISANMDTCHVVPRPPGKKAEKRKLNETDQLAKIQKLQVEKRERDEKKIEIIREKVEVDKEKLRIRKFEAEMRVMSMDTSAMNDEERAYYSNLRMKILQGNL